MEVILIQDVDNLGSAHEKVSVKNGYARNYLIPRKLAVEANPSNLKQLNERVKQLQKKEAKLMAEVNKVIEVLKASPLKLPFPMQIFHLQVQCTHFSVHLVRQLEWQFRA